MGTQHLIGAKARPAWADPQLTEQKTPVHAEHPNVTLVREAHQRLVAVRR